MFRIILLVSFSSFLCPGCKAGDPCPNAAELFPCICSQTIARREAVEDKSNSTLLSPGHDKSTEVAAGDYLTTVQCPSSKSLEELKEKVAVSLGHMSVDKLILSNIPAQEGYKLAKLPHYSWLENVSIRYFEIKDTKLAENLDIWTLSSQKKSLISLKVSNCSLFGALTESDKGTVRTDGLYYLNHLQHLDFSSNHLTAIQKSAFMAPSYGSMNHITSLIFAKNNIQSIENNAFRYLNKLKYIDLSHNNLRSVLKEYFENNPEHLQHIDLSWNYITDFPYYFFDNMKVLKFVDVSHNLLFHLPENPWSRVWKKLDYIDVSDNPIQCNCKMLWLLPALVSSSGNSNVTGRCISFSGGPNPQIVNHDFISLTRYQLC